MDARVRALHGLARQSLGLVNRWQVAEVGLSAEWLKRACRRGELERVSHNVFRFAGSPADARSTALASVWSSGRHALLSHESAATLHGLPGFSLLPAHVTVEIAHAPSRNQGSVYRSTHIPDRHRSQLMCIPVTTLERTLFDLCGRVHPLRAERAVDTALARDKVTMRSLWHVLLDLAGHGRGGTVVMREILETRRDDANVGPESEIEDRFARLVMRHRLEVPERQVDLGDERGWIGRVDFYFRRARLVVETDGWPWHRSLLDRQRDAARDARLEASGRRVMRLIWADVTDRESMTVERLRQALAV